MSTYIRTPFGSAAVFDTFTSLPPSANQGALAFTEDTKVLYIWDPNLSAWDAIGGGGAPLAVGSINGQPRNANGLTITGNVLYTQTFDSTHPGMVTASGGGTTNFLRADGTWATPPINPGTVTSVSVTTANGVSGSVATPTTTPAITLTLGAITPSSVAATGTVTGSNLSGTNTGDVTLTAVGSSPNADGASLSGQALTLQPADGSNPGLMTSGTQTIGGAKSFNSTVKVNESAAPLDIQLGTLDSFSRTQILNNTSSPIVRVGTWQIDGDATSNASQGIVVYGDSLAAAPISNTAGSFARIKNNRFGLFDIDPTLPGYTSGAYYFRIDDTAMFYADNNGTQTFSVQRTTGVINSSSLSPSLPVQTDASSNLISSAINLSGSQVTSTLGASNGGTGQSSLTLNNVILGNGTSAVQFVAPGTSGNLLTSNGTTWTSAAPSFSPGAISLTQNHVLVGNASNVAADVAMSGDVAIVASGATTVQNNVVSNAKLAQMGANTIKGNNTGSTANAADLTVAQVNTMLGDILANGTVAFSADQSMGSNKLTNLANGTAGTDAVNYSQLTSISTGLIWQPPISDPDLVDDSLSTPPGSPVFSLTYIIAATPTGAWTGLAGHAVWWDGAEWIDISTGNTATSGQGTAVAVGDRFLIAAASAGGPAHVGGSFAGGTHDQQVATVTGNTPGSFTYSFVTPLANWAVSDQAIGSQHANNSFTYVSSAPYTFTVTAANATSGATYTNNGQTFTVVSTISGGTSLLTTGTGFPSASGTLTKATGTGDATITFSSYVGSNWIDFAGPSKNIAGTALAYTGNTLNVLVDATTITTNGSNQLKVITGNLTDVGTDGITITGGTNAVVGSGTSISQHVADTTHNGYLSSTDWNTFNGKQAAGNYITALTGDATATGPGSVALTLATVNGNVGSFGSSTSIPSFTVNAKGLITAASGNVVIAPAGTLTGTTLASNVVTSSLTSVGTITSGTWNGTTIDVSHGGTGQTSLTAHDVLVGNGTSGITQVAPSATSGVALVSNGSAADPSFGAIDLTSSSAVSGALTVPNGGTGQTSLTNHGVLIGAGTSAITQLAAAAAGTVLSGQGTGSDPAFTATPTLGVNTTTSGTLALANGGASGASITLKNLGATTAYNFNLPTTAGTSGQVLTSQGGAASSMTWTTPTTGTVTSVAFSDASTTPIYSITGSPVTTSGTLTQTLTTQSANLVFAGPASGAAAQPTFRSLNVADMTIATQAISATTIDWSLGNLYTKTLGANTTFTFSNQTSGQTIVVRLTNTASNFTVTWPTVRWTGGTPPTMSTGAVSDVYTFLYDGSNTYGSVVANMS